MLPLIYTLNCKLRKNTKMLPSATEFLSGDFCNHSHGSMIYFVFMLDNKTVRITSTKSP